MSEIKERLRERLRSLGFDDVRFAAASPPVHGGLAEWLAAGMHADMEWMKRTAEKRLDPERVLPGVRSVIMLGVNYWSDQLSTGGGAARPNWARYALHEDYHDNLKRALQAAGGAIEELCQVGPTGYRAYVDTGPVLERSWATRAGLGFTGKNAMLISRRFGNWLFLAAILTTVEFPPDPAVRRPAVERGVAGSHPEGEEVGSLCGKCTRCLDACPTAAFPRPGVVDARRCVSYQTIENKGVIPRDLRAGIGVRIYGCDVCLEVCPWNRFAQEGRKMLLASRYDLAALGLDDLLGLTPESFAEIFRRTPIKRLKLTGLLRNACVVAGNLGDPQHLPALIRLATEHASPLVRAHAVWAVYRLKGELALEEARKREQDPLVLAEYAGG